MSFFLTADKANQKKGRPFTAYTINGGETWQFKSWIGPEPEGLAIMPSVVRFSEETLLAAVRRLEKGLAWIEIYRSDDLGLTWQFLNRPVSHMGFNPGQLIKLRDGRLCLTFGRRLTPYGIRARISEDMGSHWSDDIILRDDGGCADIGYPLTVQRSDGKLVTVYYFAEHAAEERYIAATIWQI